MQSKATTVAQYLAELPAERREAIQAVRKVIRDNLDSAFQETMQYGMIGYSVPHSVYPPGYHCDPKQPLPFGGLASQKNYMSVYLMPVYGGDEQWFRQEWAKSGKKLDMGKCCVRFTKVEDLALDVIGKAVAKYTGASFVERYEQLLAEQGIKHKGKGKAQAQLESKPAKTLAKVSTGKAAVKKTAAKTAATKKTGKSHVAKKKAAKKSAR